VPINNETLKVSKTFRVFFDLAERVGFEPTVAQRATTVFETVPFSRSGTSPSGRRDYNLNFCVCVKFWIKYVLQPVLIKFAH
jgi:hypothetical protein